MARKALISASAAVEAAMDGEGTAPVAAAILRLDEAIVRRGVCVNLPSSTRVVLAELWLDRALDEWRQEANDSAKHAAQKCEQHLSLATAEQNMVTDENTTTSSPVASLALRRSWLRATLCAHRAASALAVAVRRIQASGNSTGTPKRRRLAVEEKNDGSPVPTEMERSRLEHACDDAS